MLECYSNFLTIFVYLILAFLFQDKSYTTFQHQRTSAESNPATPQALDPTLNFRLEDYVESRNMDQTPNKLSAATTGMQSPSSERAEPAGMVPIRCLSPRVTLSRQCGPSGSVVGNQVLDVNNSVSLSRRLLQEVKLDDFLHHKVLLTVLPAINPHPEFFL